MKHKYTILLGILLISGVDLYSQINKRGTWNLSTGADVLYPENSFRRTHGWGFGVSAKAEYLFQKHTSLTFSSGYYTLAGKTAPDNPTDLNVYGIPVKAGLRYYLGNFYIGGEGGFVYQGNYKPRNGFVYAFSIGDEIITNRNNENSLDISLRHEVWKTDISRAFAGIRIAYEFRLGKSKVRSTSTNKSY